MKTPPQYHEQFILDLRRTLNHFYDPDELRRSPLAKLFGVAGQMNTPSLLQKILTDSIEQLKPLSKNINTPDRKIYDLLLYRYIQQFSQTQVAVQLNVSLRQLKREQEVALEALASLLWDRYDINPKQEGNLQIEAHGKEIILEEPVHPISKSLSPTEVDLNWVSLVGTDRSSTLEETLPPVLLLVQSLAERRQVNVHVSSHFAIEATADSTLTESLPIHPTVFRQMLLALFTTALDYSTPGDLTLKISPKNWGVFFEVSCPSKSIDQAERNTNLVVASQLAQKCGGELVVRSTESSFCAELFLPALEQIPVLIVDDNPDSLLMFQRGLSNTQFRFIGENNPENVMRSSEEHKPQIIIIDIMMPQIDGWETLGRIKQHPKTEHIPVIICTILAQESLGFALGASGYLRKPFTRSDLLAELDRCLPDRGMVL